MHIKFIYNCIEASVWLSMVGFGKRAMNKSHSDAAEESNS